MSADRVEYTPYARAVHAVTDGLLDTKLRGEDIGRP